MKQVTVKVVGPLAFAAILPGDRGIVDADKYNVPAAVEAGLVKVVRTKAGANVEVTDNDGTD